VFLASKFYNKSHDAITIAVNSIGTDTDSIAAFTGGIIGALRFLLINANNLDLGQFDRSLRILSSA